MMDTKERLQQLLSREGKLDADENRWLLNYLDTTDHEALKELSQEQYEDDLAMLRNFLSVHDSKRILENIHRRIYIKQPLIKRLSFRIAVAASVILALTVGLLLYRGSVTDTGSVRLTKTSSGWGERKNVLLTDGTKIWLSPGTTLSYPDTFNGDTRTVTLNGEAFFEVAHDASHPFIIQSGTISTRVLGTSFNVAAYRDKERINVTVVTGKVSVASHETGHAQHVVMVANQRAVYDKSSKSLIKQDDPEASRFLRQREGVFTYRGSTLQAVAGDLSQQYHIRIVVAGAAKNNAYYGTLDLNEPAEQVLNKLCLVTEVTWTKNGNMYTIN